MELSTELARLVATVRTLITRLVSTEPARLMTLVHALITAAVSTGILIADHPLVQFALLAAGIVGDGLAGKAVRDRVSPAYSDGHPVTNLPPDGHLHDEV